ncbi:anhydro-N-acetylmuramic acid kinase [Winogradskyella wandonensis]|uniref:Anhydro-N-acetylmuramic acid kinase n=1 Tax=Winogradskyella wandonensis TaxID=1442586 RepID=A0A4R1KTJ2_9FLAO|nr:anhydro-N-acetylmuramic acid kinase [Winogradskyella wandonensis]TCK68496.1 anhydro-N-acetylmuramic acid kinase [Winogradskyella wandonensis]
MLTKSYNVVTVMSGTSLDGIDLLHAKFSFNAKWKFQIFNFETVGYSENWIKKLKQLTKFSKAELKQIDDDYSLYLAERISEFIRKHHIKNLDFVASHGHTALHKPAEGFTYQIGNQQIVADKIQHILICDFRVQDVEYGGQGAPLVPIGDKLLFSEYDYCVNLGGFANISFEDSKERIAFDICPVNIVLNHYVSKLGFNYDNKGEIAKSGNVNDLLLARLNSLDFYRLHPPKSLGLEWVENAIFPLIDSYNLQIKDILRTFVEHSAFQISKFLNQEETSALITGGGAYNLFLINRIKELSNCEIVIPSDQIIEYKEALIFGLLGVLKKENQINCLSSVTGAIKDHSSGKIFRPRN